MHLSRYVVSLLKKGEFLKEISCASSVDQGMDLIKLRQGEENDLVSSPQTKHLQFQDTSQLSNKGGDCVKNILSGYRVILGSS